MDMELTWPEDERGTRSRSGRNISSLEKWVSIAAGAGLATYGLSRLRSNGWLWAGLGGLLLRRGVTAHCDVYEALGVNTSRTGDTRTALGGSRGVNVLESVTINRPIPELYRFWRNLENLPQFMRHLASVEKVTDSISRWRAIGPARMTVEWEAEVYNEVPDKLIAWRSLDNSQVVSAGSVNFDDAGPGRGTRVTVHLQYSPPGGKLGARIARLFGADAETEIREDLRRFKQLVEAGEVATTSGSQGSRF
jgi:uncharacterized membrane protein